MGYLQALNLLIRTYKATKGYLPKGIDMLKLKMKARQKIIDSKKVIKFPQGGKDKINPFEPRPTKPEGIMKTLTGKGKGKVAETEAQMLARMKKQNKESVARLKEKKEKTLGEKLKDYKGDPDAMKDGGKVKKKRKHNDNIDDEDIGEGESKERFLRVMPEVDGIPRSDGIMELATGGMTNIGNTYDNNPTLQSQYPNKQDYLDLFAQQTTTTPQMATAYQSTGSIDPINPILPIIPIPQSDGGGGGGGITRGGPNRFDYGYTSLSTDKEQGESAKGGYRTPGTKANKDFLYDIGVATIPDEDYDKIEELKDTFYGIKDGIKDGLGGLIDIAKYVNPLDPTKFDIRNIFNITKKAFSKKSDKIVADKIAEEAKAAKEEALSSLRASMARDAARNAQQDWTGSSNTYSGGMDTTTGNYDDPFDSGQTE